jgi:hypothetical protein
VQLAPHIILGIAHVAEHVPPAQTSFAAHMRPHIPQWSRSLAVLTHCPPQMLCPIGQVQAPLTHVAFIGQATPQPPQLTRLLAVSMQRPSQNICPDGHGTSSGGTGRSSITGVSITGASITTMSALTTSGVAPSCRSDACGSAQAAMAVDASSVAGRRSSKRGMRPRVTQVVRSLRTQVRVRCASSHGWPEDMRVTNATRCRKPGLCWLCAC